MAILNAFDIKRDGTLEVKIRISKFRLHNTKIDPIENKVKDKKHRIMYKNSKPCK